MKRNSTTHTKCAFIQKNTQLEQMLLDLMQKEQKAKCALDEIQSDLNGFFAILPYEAISRIFNKYRAINTSSVHRNSVSGSYTNPVSKLPTGAQKTTDNRPPNNGTRKKFHSLAEVLDNV